MAGFFVREEVSNQFINCVFKIIIIILRNLKVEYPPPYKRHARNWKCQTILDIKYNMAYLI